jgi:hypothetical protein
VVGLWLVVAVTIAPLSSEFEDAPRSDPVDYRGNVPPMATRAIIINWPPGRR